MFERSFSSGDCLSRPVSNVLTETSKGVEHCTFSSVWISSKSDQIVMALFQVLVALLIMLVAFPLSIQVNSLLRYVAKLRVSPQSLRCLLVEAQAWNLECHTQSDFLGGSPLRL